MKYAQLFCTVADLIADAQAPGVDDARMFQAVREASDYLQKEIGWFMPVTLTHKYNGCGLRILFIAPVLSITSLTNEDIDIQSTDYLLKPDNGFWPNGPATQLVVDDKSPRLAVWFWEEDAVVITGRWGLYERTGDTGATVQDTTAQNDAQTTLLLDDGGKVSPGMVLLIGDEQESVTGWGDPTMAVTTLDGAITASDEVITVADGTLVNVGELLRVDFEQMRVKDKRTNQLSVIRGWNGTGRIAHITASEVDVYRTVTVERGMNGTISAAHDTDTAISRYFAPDDIQYLTKQIATLIINKAKSGYQGRTGNAEMGVVFYNDAFPKYEIERIAARYKIPRS